MASSPEDLFRLYADDVRTYMATQVAARDVDDCVSEVFVHLIRQWPEVPKAHLRWLLEKAVEVARVTRAQAPFPQEELPASAAPAAGVEGAADLGLLEVEAVLEDFSRADREVLGLAVAGLDHVEAALVLGCTSGAYRVRLHRARGRLKEALRGKSRGEDS